MKLFDNFKWASRIFAILLLIINFLPSAYFPLDISSASDSKASLKINPSLLRIDNISFTILPNQIYEGENLVFTLNPVVYQQGSIASNLPCRLTLVAPDSSIVIFDGLTNNNGTCIYNTALPLTSQGLTLVSGDPSKLNNTLGIGSGFATVTFENNQINSNVANYTVRERAINLGPFFINPKEIDVNGNLIFQLTNVTNIDGSIGRNIPATMVINTPQGEQVIISGFTDSNGNFTFDTSKTLQEQGLTLLSGTLNNVNGIVGNGQAYAFISFNNVVYTSNADSYRVRSPQLINVPNIVQTIVRTGGGVPFGIVIILVLGFAVLMVRSSLKKDEKNR